MRKIGHYHFINWIILFLVSFPVVFCKINFSKTGINNIERLIQTLRNDVLKVDQYQNFIDENVKFKIIDVDTSSFLQNLSQLIGSKFQKRIEAVNQLHDVVKTTYSNSSNWGQWLNCCMVDETSMDYNSNYRTKVDLLNLCNVVAPSAVETEKAPSASFLKIAKENVKNHPGLKWQYFGSDTGVLTQYPATKMCSLDYGKNETYDESGGYDNRFRPWYVQASAPTSKDVVLVIDRSASMRKFDRMKATKNAAVTVLNTLTPDDRVAVVAFSNQAYALGTRSSELAVSLTNSSPHNSFFESTSCFNNTMAVAIPSNIKHLSSIIQKIVPAGETYYTHALRIAFDLLQNAFFEDKKQMTSKTDLEVAQSRERVIMFLSDGEPSDLPHKIFKMIHDRNRELYNRVALLCFALGKSTFGSALQQMAKQNFSFHSNDCQENCEMPPPHHGMFKHVRETKNLRSVMGFYYNFFFSHKRDKDERSVVWSVPYFDVGGLGMVITAASAVIVKDELVGVVGVDLSLDELLADAIYFRAAGDIAFTFLLDSTGRVVTHPFMPKPSSVMSSPIITDFAAFERDEAVQKFLKETLHFISTNRGFSGNSLQVSDVFENVFETTRLHPTVHKGVIMYESTSRYACSAVSHTKFVLCLVVEKDINSVTVLDKQDVPQDFDFLYHKYQSFMHFGTYSEDAKPVFKNDIRSIVLASWPLEGMWKNSSNSSAVLWRYFGTPQGVFRIYPGVEMPKLYEPSSRPWYETAKALLWNSEHMTQNSKANAISGTAISTPYLDANGQGLVLTVSSTVLVPHDQDSSGHSYKVFGVLGADLELHKFDRYLVSSFPECDQIWSCIAIDTSGYVVCDQNLVMQDKSATSLASVSNYHIIHSYSAIASVLIGKKVLVHEKCIDISTASYRTTYHVDIEELKRVVDLPFRISHIPSTNIIVIAVSHDIITSEVSCTAHKVTDSQCVGSATSEDFALQCESPCVDTRSPTAHYSPCLNFYNYTWTSDPPPCHPVKLKPKFGKGSNGYQDTQVVALLNEASMATNDKDKINKLSQVQELVVNKRPDLLDSFNDEIVAFQTDRSAEVRKYVVGFMEEACKADQELFSKFLLNLYMLLVDESTAVLKKVIQSATQLYRLFIQWVLTCKKEASIVQAMWKTMCDMQSNVMGLLDSENDGVRTQAVKFAEKVITTLSEKQRHSELPKKVEAFSSLDQLPTNHAILCKDEMKLLGEAILAQLLKFVSSPAISSVNLMASMGTLTTIAKQRPQFMSTVVQAFEALHANLPPTLAKTQVTSVRKHLKMQLLNLLRHPGSIEFHPQITNLLYDLGTNSSEIARNMPKMVGPQKDKKSQAKKRAQDDDGSSGLASKKSKIDLKDDSDDDDDDDVIEKQPATSKHLHNSAVDITADELVPLLTPENVANLVLLSMVMLPEKIPDAFQASYTPIESAGTMEQIMHLARLLSIQMTAVGIGSGVQQAAEMQKEEEAKRKEEREKAELEKEKNKPSVPIKTLIGGTTVTEEVKEVPPKMEKKVAIENISSAVPSRSLQRRMQGFHLAAITNPLSLDAKDIIIKNAVLRVLKAEKNAIAGGVHDQWRKILTSLVAQFGGDLHRSLAKFILSDSKNRSQLAFQWLYEEFNICLENSRGLNDRVAQENYDACMMSLLQGLLDKHDAKEGLFAKLVQQAPLITEGAVKLIHKYCEDPRRAQAGIALLHELILQRPHKRLLILRVLLNLSSSKVEKARLQAVEVSKKFYEKREFHDLIEQYAVAQLSFLKLSEPPKELVESTSEEKKWTETMMQQCMTIFLSLLPLNHNLIHKLAEVYVEASADIKRVVLRALEAPVNGMGMASQELLLLVETCPKGAETLVTRMLHILTDREHPTLELVGHVRDLYQKRVPDVRFLIPVINGLEKHEVLLALPKLIKLNPPVVKGVFNRLLGVQRHEESQPSYSALSPIELLVALHNIDQNKADVKSVIKATSLCFAEKSVYTSEVLVTVINHLVEQEVMPTLLMRTVIQALITYPQLSGFVMNVLQRLIIKRVWEQTKVWEGFVRCCQRMKPQSFQVLLQLPPAQLSSVFETSPDLREPLLQHVNKFTPQQRQHISPAIISVLESTPEQRLAEQQAAAAQRALEELRAREMEAQAKVAQEWERQQLRQAAENARLEAERSSLEQAKEIERRMQEQKERAMAMASFQQRSVKEEPTPTDPAADAFPAPSPPAEVAKPDAPPSGDVLNAPAGFTPEVFPFVSVAAPSHSLASGQPMLTEAFVPAVPPTFSGVTIVSPPEIKAPLPTQPGMGITLPSQPDMGLPPSSQPGIGVPSRMFVQQPPSVLLPPHALNVPPPQFPQPLPEVKREKRSPTPTLDERADLV